MRLTGATDPFLTKLVQGVTQISEGVQVVKNEIRRGETGLSEARREELLAELNKIRRLADRLVEDGDNS